MPELRKDSISENWVIIATERGKRPSDFARPDETRKGGTCPFCYGNEHMTPPEVLAYRDGSATDSPGWSVRMVPNKFPALSPDIPRRSVEKVGPYLLMAGSGGHDVLVESPRHDSTLGSHPVEQVELVLKAVRERMAVYRDSGAADYVQVFKNWGRSAGASLEHTHFQLIALPLVPEVIQSEMQRLGLNGGRRGCALCEALEYESGNAGRVVDESADYLVYCPFASRVPYEMWIAPRAHEGHFEDTPDESLGALASALSLSIRRLEAAFEAIPYNIVMHTAPFGSGRDSFHWHLEILPRLTIAAGFEFGTGYYINPTPPEMAAEFLRQAELRPEQQNAFQGERQREGGIASDTGP